MRIHVEKYQLEVTEDELWTIIFAFRDSLAKEETIEHCARQSGMDTLKSNNTSKIEMFSQVCTRLGRPDLFESEMENIEQAIADKRDEYEAREQK